LENKVLAEDEAGVNGGACCESRLPFGVDSRSIDLLGLSLCRFGEQSPAFSLELEIERDDAGGGDCDAE
jgi:hypothetical protein